MIVLLFIACLHHINQLYVCKLYTIRSKQYNRKLALVLMHEQIYQIVVNIAGMNSSSDLFW